MSEAFIGEIRPMAFSFAPRGWALCNGQLLAINQNQALFSLLGTMYGGDGVTTFALPNLKGRVPIHFGNGYSLGESAGQTIHTLIASEIPAHNHILFGTDADATDTDPTDRVVAKATETMYAATTNSTLGASSVGVAGQSQPHENMQPSLAISFCIALVGIYPSRS